MRCSSDELHPCLEVRVPCAKIHIRADQGVVRRALNQGVLNHLIVGIEPGIVRRGIMGIVDRRRIDRGMSGRLR